jgi:DNA gyrase subunit A
VGEIPEAERSSRGRSLQQLFGLEKSDRVVAILSLARAPKDGALVFVTAGGTIKRTSLEAFGSGRAGGVNAINLRDGDTVLDVHASDGTGDVVLVTRTGRAIRFAEAEVPEMGRTAAGVRGMKLTNDDRIAGVVVLRRDGTLCGVSERGWALRIEAEEIPAQRRDGKGVACFRLDEKTGKLAGAVEVLPGEDLMLVTVGGAPFRAPADGVAAGGMGAALAKAVTMPGASRVAKVVRVVGEKAGQNPEDGGPGGGDSGTAATGDENGPAATGDETGTAPEGTVGAGPRARPPRVQGDDPETAVPGEGDEDTLTPDAPEDAVNQAAKRVLDRLRSREAEESQGELNL